MPHWLESLAAYLPAALGAGRVQIAEFALLSGGAIQENWALDLVVDGGPLSGEVPVVLRCDSATAGVAISHSRAQEFALLRTVFDAGVTVPEPLALCEQTDVIGRPFFIMRRAQGTAEAHLLIKDRTWAADRVALTRRLGRELAAIHAIEPPVQALEFLPMHDESPAMQRVHAYQAFLDQHPVPYPALEWGLQWLARNAPPRGALALSHGDFRTGNYMVDTQGLTAILDWEFASWSDPLEDIAWFCAKCWRFGQVDLQAGGVGSREDFYAGYEAKAGVSIDREAVFYWEVMAHMKWAIVAIQQAQRFCSGEEDSLLLALTGHKLPELEWEILSMTEHQP